MFTFMFILLIVIHNYYNYIAGELTALVFATVFLPIWLQAYFTVSKFSLIKMDAPDEPSSEPEKDEEEGSQASNMVVVNKNRSKNRVPIGISND